MIVDERTYTIVTGKLREYLALYQQHGLPVQVRHLGEPFGWFTTETGVLDQVVHMWSYADAGERERRRAALAADPDWRRFAELAYPFIRHKKNRLLRAAPFFRPAPA